MKTREHKDEDDFVAIRNMYGAPFVVRRSDLPQRTFLDDLPWYVKVAVCVGTWMFFRYCTIPILDFLSGILT